MAKRAIVVVDPQRNENFEIDRFRDGYLRAGYNPVAAEVKAASHAPGVREVGFLHTAMEEECPLGHPNCRNCGDPEFLESCQAAGHCELCGTAHGIAPEATLRKNGFAMLQGPEVEDSLALLESGHIRQRAANQAVTAALDVLRGEEELNRLGFSTPERRTAAVTNYETAQAEVTLGEEDVRDALEQIRQLTLTAMEKK